MVTSVDSQETTVSDLGETPESMVETCKEEVEPDVVWERIQHAAVVAELYFVVVAVEAVSV